MIYIKLDNNMDLTMTVKEPIYRGDNLNRKIIYLIPLKVGEIDMLTATAYLSYIRADGIADVVILERQEEKYNESYYQYILPVTCKMTRFPGEICTWIQIYSGTPSNPTIAKSGECMIYVEDSKNMDDYLCDHQITALYQLQKGIDETKAAVSEKADNIIFNPEDSTIQLTANGNPIGDKIVVQTDTETAVVDIQITDDGEMLITLSDGTTKNLGSVVDHDGAVYVPHVSDRKILTFTIEEHPNGIPDPVDLNPNDEWSDIGDTNIISDYTWEQM